MGTVEVPEDHHGVVPVEARLDESLADRGDVRLELLVGPGAPLSRDDVAGLDGGDLWVRL